MDSKKCEWCEFFYEDSCLAYCLPVEDVTNAQCENAYTFDEELESGCL